MVTSSVQRRNIRTLKELNFPLNEKKTKSKMAKTSAVQKLKKNKAKKIQKKRAALKNN